MKHLYSFSRMSRSAAALLVTVGIAMSATPAQATDALGPAFPVNTPNHPNSPVTARSGYGDFIIAWIDSNTGSAAVRAQRFNANGQTVGSVITVAPENDAGGSIGSASVRVAMDSSGEFIVLWSGNGDLFAQTYHADGSPRSRVQVASAGNSADATPLIGDVAMDAGGAFTVAWENDSSLFSQALPNTALGFGSASIIVRRFKADGSAVGASSIVERCSTAGFAVNYFGFFGADCALGKPAIASADDGKAIVVWQRIDNPNALRSSARPPRARQYARRVNSSGNPVGGTLQVNEQDELPGSLFVRKPSVASDAAGNFEVVWGTEAGTLLGRHYRRATGLLPAPQADPVATISAAPVGLSPKIDMNAAGDAVVVWEAIGPGGLFLDPQIASQALSPAGQLVGSAIPVSDSAKGSNPDVAVDADAGFVVTWLGNSLLARLYPRQ